MKLKNRNQTPGNGGFVFFFENPKTKSTESVDGVNGIRQLTDKAKIIFHKAGMTVPENLEQIIEHQICLRQSFPLEDCWNGGIGDKIHQQWVKPFLTKVEGRASKFGRAGRLIAKAVNKIKSCGGCGGTKVYKEGKNNLGRAGTLNQLSK